MNFSTVIAPLLRTVSLLGPRLTALEQAQQLQVEVQTVNANGTLTLTCQTTLVSITGGSTISFPTASTSNQGYEVRVHNASGTSVTVNSVSVANGSYAQWFSSGSVWRRIA